MVRANEPLEYQGADLKADILLVTVTRIEAQAVLNLFSRETGQAFQRRFIGDKTYFDLGSVNGARVMMVQSEMGAGGPGGALLVVDEGIRVLSASAVIMVGIAFGVDDKKQEIGDILVSQQLLGYEVQKIAMDEAGQIKLIPRGDRPRASTRLLDHFQGGLLDWQGANVDFGLILSGDKLVDQQDFRDQLRNFAPEALGGEMEGTGLYSAAHRRKVDWILIKAICDWADGNKGQDKRSRQQLAAENAARFTLHVLKQGGFVEEAPPISKPPPASKGASSAQVCGTLLYKYDMHASWVVAVAWEPGGSRIASAGGDGIVRVWESETGEHFLTYRGHTSLLSKINFQPTVYTIAWSPEGLRIVSGGDGARVYVWNATTGQTLVIYQGHSGILPNVYAAVWSPDGKQIASACSSIGIDKTVHVWDAASGESLSRYAAHYGLMPDFSMLALAWSPDGTRIAATGADKTIRIWNVVSRQLIATYQVRSKWPTDLAWSPDSRYLVSAHPDHVAQVWDTFAGTNIMKYQGHSDSIRRVAWSPDGTRIASASNDRTVQIWEALSGRHIYTYRGHDNWATSVAWSPDGTRIASASNDRTVQVWYVGK